MAEPPVRHICRAGLWFPETRRYLAGSTPTGGGKVGGRYLASIGLGMRPAGADSLSAFENLAREVRSVV